MPKKGDTVLYTCEFDADSSYSPNVGPALVTKVNADGSLDLAIFVLNGQFFKCAVMQGQPGDRMTWHPKE